MNFKEPAEIRQDLVTSYNKLIDVDLSEGTTERDAFVEAPTEGQLKQIWTGLQYLYKLQAPFLYQEDLLVEDLDVYCKENGVGEIPPTYSNGSVTLYTSTEPSKDITINDGDQVSNGSINFEINGYYTIPYATRSNYYNSINRRYEIEVPVTSTTPGTGGNAGIGTITTIASKIEGIDGCTNASPISGGKNSGTITDRLNRVKQLQKGKTLGSLQGIKLYVENYTRPVNVVGAKDTLMLRTEGLGGGVDVYVRGLQLDGASDTVEITSTGLSGNGESILYTSTGIIFETQPVNSITTVIKNGIILGSTYYSLVKDTGLLKNSTKSQDKLVLTSTGITQVGYFVPNDSVELRYNYNKLLHTIEDDLVTPTNLYDNRDILLREQTDLYIDIYARVQLTANTTLATIVTAYSTSVTNLFDTLEGDLIELIDLLSILRNTTGVDNIDVPTAYITPADGRTKTANGDIPLYKNEYPKLRTLQLVEATF